MSAHPPHCHGCRGTGWKPGPPRHQTINGQTVAYSTLIPCDYPWHRDDPTPPEPLEREHTAAQDAFATGYAQGLAELEQMRPKENQ